jgi:DNA-binding transcriptional ArsR family regulator
MQHSVTPARFGDLACGGMDDEAAAALAKALSHRLRLEYLRALSSRRELSPSEYARDFGEPLGNVSYHVKALLGAGVVEISTTVPRRGAVEHRYSFSGPRAGVAKKMIRLLAKA